jgi:4'-phosphopantetheinyl transferase EntD
MTRTEPSLDPFCPSVLRSMLGPRVAIAVAKPALVTEQLFPAERDYLARAVDKRKAEFGTGRVCARHALSMLGVAPAALVPDADRAPRWPPGILGSISHTAGCCAVAVTTTMHLAGLGLDVELDTPLDSDLEPLLCTSAEQAWLKSLDDPERERVGKLFFSAKEAFYKCQYRLTRTLLDFTDVDLEIDLMAGTFRVANLTRSGAPWDLLYRIVGRFRREAGFVISTATLGAEFLDRC